MKIIRDAVKHVLRHDVIVLAHVGLDDDDIARVYELLAKPNTIPPFLIFQLLPGERPQGTYADQKAIEIASVQVTSWGRNEDEAWALAQAADDALDHGDWDLELTPYKNILILRRGGMQAIPDQDTKWIQVPVTYQVSVGR